VIWEIDILLLIPRAAQLPLMFSSAIRRDQAYKFSNGRIYALEKGEDYTILLSLIHEALYVINWDET
jgi:hypothetical protein